jgi:hypothetical protein
MMSQSSYASQAGLLFHNEVWYTWDDDFGGDL